MKTFCFDIDETICNTIGTDYKNSQPIVARIDQVNKLKKKGNKIIFYTARGFLSGLDLYELTFNQLKSWGVSFDELYLGKPAADYYIDDKSVDYFNWFQDG